MTITVTAVNDPPVAVDDTLTTAEDTAGLKNVLANDTDPDGDTLTVTGKTNGTHGTVTCTTAGACTYTPNRQLPRPRHLHLHRQRRQRRHRHRHRHVTVTPVNDAPVAVNDTVTTAEDTAAVKNVLTNDTDVDGDTLTVTAEDATARTAR